MKQISFQKIIFLILFLVIPLPILTIEEEITPYKFTDVEMESLITQELLYEIPLKARHTIARPTSTIHDLVYYQSLPNRNNFPIALICTGSSSRDYLWSVIHLHRFFLKELLELGVGLITVEQQGIDGNNINPDEFMQHYTRSARLLDHQTLINYLKINPPIGWNGKFIFIGVSEGGPLVTTLTMEYPHDTLATINWSGAGAWCWQDELWAFIQDLKKKLTWTDTLRLYAARLIPSIQSFNLPFSKQELQRILEETRLNPTADKEFMGMTYKYHADVLCYPPYEYDKITTPFLVVAGALDPNIHSSDEFVQQGLDVDAPLTYFRIEDMDHYVRRRPDVIEKSFEWLEKYI